MPTQTAAKRIQFDCFEVDLTAGRVFKRSLKLGLREQSFQVLALLLERPGQVVTREELRRRLWGDNVFVDFDNNLNAVVAHLREALGDSAERPRFIETLPKRGYRFIRQVMRAASTAEPARVQKARLLVLPFLNLSGDSAQEYFSDAITDEIITALASTAPEQLAVIARTTAMHYKGSHKDVARIGRELDVNYVVEGGVRRNDEVVVNVQLIQTSDQAHLFAKRYEAASRLSQITDSISADIAAHLPAIAHPVPPARTTSRAAQNLEAYSEYLHGRYEMWRWTPEGVRKAKQHFEAALARDPRFAPACDALAELYWHLGFWGFLPPDETEPIRRFYALRAHELDSAFVETQALIAFRPEKCHYADSYTYNWRETEEQMARAIDLNPTSPLLRMRHASVLMVLGENEKAIAEIEPALESDPLSIELRFWLTEALFFGGQCDRAQAQAEKIIESEPQHHVGFMLLGLVLLGLERFGESIAALRRAAELSGDFPLMLGWLGLAMGLGGHTAEARGVLERLRSIAAHRFVLPSSFAWVHFSLGEIDEAFAWLDRAVLRNDGWMPALKSYPFLKPIRQDPRFYALLRKMNLEP